MKFSKLQARHELLLDLQNQNKPIEEEVISYIDQARNEAQNYSPEERDHLRANLRYWAAYIFEKTENYPNTELAPISQPTTITLLIQNSGKVLYAVIIVAVFLLGLTQIPKIINFIQSPTSSDPSIIIYDRGGTFFIVIFGIFAIIIIFLQIIIFRRQTKLFFSMVGERVTAAVEKVRITIVGGGKRGKPLATLKVTEGPQGMVGQELKIFTESVKLGRDPERADMTFYSPEVNSSVSGLHARIERVNNSWRIVSLSQSSESFVDDIAIPLHEPHPLQSGQMVRLGYLAQQPAVFTFTSEASTQGVVAPRIIEVDFRKPQVDDDTVPANEVKVSADRKEALKQSKDSIDDIFDEFRDR